MYTEYLALHSLEAQLSITVDSNIDLHGVGSERIQSKSTRLRSLKGL